MAQSPTARHFPPPSACRWGALAIVVLLALAGTARAQQPVDVFSVAEVKVDATAESAAAARDKALADGQAGALKRLFARLIVATDLPRVPLPQAREAAQLVRDFEVSGEKASSVRYLATLSIRFKRQAVRDYLRRFEAGFAETPSKPVLVLPVFEAEGAYTLWGQPNPWRDAWQALPPIEGLVPLIRPLGDIQDVSLIAADQAVRGEADRLAGIAGHYGAGDVLVAVAGFRTGAAGEAGQPAQPSLQVALRRSGAAGLGQTGQESFALQPGEDAAAAIARVAAAVQIQVQEDWKRDNRIRFGAESELTAMVSLTGLGDWLDIKRRLAGVAVIRANELVYLSRKQARVRITYIGDAGQLALALSQRDLALEQGAVEWALRRSDTAAPQTAPSSAPSAGAPGNAAPAPPPAPSAAVPPAITGPAVAAPPKARDKEPASGGAGTPPPPSTPLSEPVQTP